MATYLLLWNPKGYPTQRLLDEIEENRQRATSSVRWNVATRRPQPGDRVFMMRVGSQQGIIGTGWVSASPTRQPNWDPVKAAEGKTQLFIEVEFEQLTDHPLIPLEELKRPPFAEFRWTPQGSGVIVPPDLADRLEQRWASAHTGNTRWLIERPG